MRFIALIFTALLSLFSSPAFAITARDGHNSNSTATASVASLALTTTQSNDVIYVVAETNVATTTISDNFNGGGGLTWTQRVNNVNLSGTFISSWWAKAPSAISSGSVTVHTGSSTTIILLSWGVSGANTTTPFDAGGPVTTNANPTSIAITTTTANDFVFAAVSNNQGSSGSPFADIDAGSAANFLSAGFDVVSGTGTFTYSTQFTGTFSVGLMEGIVPASGAASPPMRTLTGAGQ